MAIDIWRPRWGLSPGKPFHSLEEAEKMFEDFFGRSYYPSLWHRAPFFEEEWTPVVEIFEKANNYIIKAELPGMKEEDIDVSISNDMLTIKGERFFEDDVKDDDYHCCERYYGSFYRSISLPANAEASKADACLTDGILEITIPKEKESESKKLPVSTKKKASVKVTAQKPKETVKKKKSK